MSINVSNLKVMIMLPPWNWQIIPGAGHHVLEEPQAIRSPSLAKPKIVTECRTRALERKVKVPNK
jgi:hypothetical protein